MIAEAFLIGCTVGACVEKLAVRRRAKTRPAVSAVVSSEETGGASTPPTDRVFEAGARPTVMLGRTRRGGASIFHSAPCRTNGEYELLEFPISDSWDEDSILSTIAAIEAL